jgi:hypothetical protein
MKDSKLRLWNAESINIRTAKKNASVEILGAT